MIFTDEQREVYQENADEWGYTTVSNPDGGANEWGPENSGIFGGIPTMVILAIVGVVIWVIS